jgi:hypothetical protein
MIQSQARPLWDKRPKATKTQHFTPADCQLAKDRSHCICPAGKQMIAARFATVEPVFGNLRHNKWLTRFTRRGRVKMDGQWKL